MSLLVTPERVVDEGPLGFRFRLAASNLLSVRDLAELGISDEVDPIHGGTPSTVADGEEPFTPWVRRWSRFCPECLDRRQCWLIGWEILFADACAICGCWLVDTCNKCGAQISWRRGSLLQCSCGGYLTAEQSSTAPAAVFGLSQALQIVAQGTKPIDMPAFHGLNLGQCVRLVRLLGTYGSSHESGVPQKVLNVDKLTVSWPITSMASEILAAWPAGFHALLGNLQRSGNAEEKGRMSKAFGGLYSALYRGLKDTEFDFLRAAFENYVAAHWTGAIGRRNRRLDASVLKGMAWIPASHACQILHVSRRRLTDLIQDGSVQGEARMTAGHRKFVVVKRVDVEKLALTLDDGISLLEVSIRLGLKRQRLLALLPIICPQAKKLGVQGCPWAIPSNWIECWETLIQTQVQVVSTDSGTITLGHLIRYWPWTTEQVGLLLADIFNGSLVPVGAIKFGNGVGALILCVAKLDEWFTGKQRQACPELTIPEVALRIGVKQEVVYALVRSGLITASLRRIGRRSVQKVGVTALQTFEQRYILGRDVAQSLGRSPRAIAEFLLAAGIRPIAGPGVDRCRQLIYDREVIDECLRRNGLERPAHPSPVPVRYLCAHACEDLVYSGQKSQPLQSKEATDSGAGLASYSDSEDPPIPISNGCH